MSSEAVTEVEADAAELRAEGGEDGEVGGLVVEVVGAAAAAQVSGAADQRLQGGERPVEENFTKSDKSFVLIANFLPEFHDSKRFVAVVDPEADRPQDDVQVVHNENPEGIREALQERGSPADGHGSAGDGDLH